MPKKRRGSRNF
jgi:hypothetical protein